MEKKEIIKIFEKRKHVRFPVMRDMAKPILVRYNGEHESMPAFLIDLSAGGIGIITFQKLKPGMKLQLNLDLPGLKIENINAEVMWVKQRSETFRCGIKFLHLPKNLIEKINTIARDYISCEERISLDFHKICHKKCRYYLLCDKLQKK